MWLNELVACIIFCFSTTCSEQCSTDRSPGAKAISHQATTSTPAALAAGSTSNHVQVGGTDVQGPDHIDAGVPESSHQRADSTLDHDHSIVRTSICQACFPLFCSGHLELSAKNSYGTLLRFTSAAPNIWNSLPEHLRQCCDLETFRRRLKTYLFSSVYAV